MKERERPEPGPMLPFPVPLPERFLEQIGYSGPDSLVGMHWEPMGDELTVYDRERTWCGFHDRYPYLQLMHQPQVWHWLDEHLVSLGNSEEPASHHLVVHREPNAGYILDRQRAAQVVRQQRFDPEDFLSQG